MKTLQVLSLLTSLGLSAPLLNERAEGATPGRYIAVLKQDQTETPAQILKDHVENGLFSATAATHQFKLGNFSGFAAQLSASQLETLKTDDRILYLEPDAKAYIKIEGGPQAADIDLSADITQGGAPWGLGRISHRAKGSTDYIYNSVDGEGTCAYIIDTGIAPSLAEFEGRATMVKSYVGAQVDDNGHGTHVCGTIGSKSYGVAKKAQLYGIKVLDADGSGSWSDIISGIQLAVTDSQTRNCPKGVVVNMSLGGSTSQAVNDASNAMVDAGLFLAVAAGNEAADYHTSSPASASNAFSVAASDVNDKLASFSNYGYGLGLIAPGVDVISTWLDGSTQSLSGTSMATPHVVGLAAYVASLSSTKLTVAQLKSQLQSLATTRAVTLGTTAAFAGTPNILAFNGASSSTAAKARSLTSVAKSESASAALPGSLSIVPRPFGSKPGIAVPNPLALPKAGTSPAAGA